MLYIFQILIIIISTYFFFLFSFTNYKYSYKHNLVKHTFLNNSYTIFTIDNVLNDYECSLIINYSKPKLERSGVISKQSVSNMRTSYNTFIIKEHIHNNNEMLKVINKLDKLSHKLSHKPIKNQEPLQVVKYDVNQEYKHHYDCCVPVNSDMCIEDTKNFGYRHSTLLIYMNNVESGGETDFSMINYKFIPKKGTGIFFYNLVSDESTYHKLSKHAGLPPLKGEKWICNKWIRTKEYKL